MNKGATRFDRRPKFEQFEARVVMSATQPIPSLHNSLIPCDVNGNGQIEPADVLVIINAINANNGGSLNNGDPAIAQPVGQDTIYLDVDGNQMVDIDDAIVVTAYLNSHGYAASFYEGFGLQCCSAETLC